MCLAHYLLTPWQNGFNSLIEADYNRASFITNHASAGDGAFSLAELGIYALSLVSADFLYHYLLGSLGRDSSELLYIYLLAFLESRDLAGGPVNVDHHVTFRLTEVLSRGRNHSLLQVKEYRFLVDVPVACYVLDDSD